MIDPSMFTVERLLDALFDDLHGNVDKWRRHVEIVPEYMPPYPGADTRPKCVVVYRTVSGSQSFLRVGRGRYFWDVYGDDFISPEWAIVALLAAPVPTSILREDEWRRWCVDENLERSR